jgi:hypothetical protein
MRSLAVSLLFLIPFSLYASARSESGGLAERVAELEAQVEELSAILEFVYVETEEINGLRGPHFIIEGANVHIRSGSGSTYPPACIPGRPNCRVGADLGNLVVGYNEFPHSETPPRGGMHNVIIGPEHNYLTFGGLVAGLHNFLRGTSTTVSGGIDNGAVTSGASVSGGSGNLARGSASSVSGGQGNSAIGFASAVSGGQDRVAPDDSNWAAGNLFEED